MNSLLKSLLSRVGIQTEEYIVNNGVTIQRFNSRHQAHRAFRVTRPPVGKVTELLLATNGTPEVLDVRFNGAG